MAWQPTTTVPADHPALRRSESINVRRYIDLKLASLGFAPVGETDTQFLSLAEELVENFREVRRQVPDWQCPVDARIQAFLDAHLADVGTEAGGIARLPTETLVLDRPGVARELSLPVNGERFDSEILSSYRIRNGVLHNPRSDRRTTQGVFHIAAGGLPVPLDKREVPKLVYARLLRAALDPPRDLNVLPFTALTSTPAHTMVSLLLRPIVRPEIPGKWTRRRMEVRFFAPGSLVSNLDFVESIFGNGGDPALPENDSALDTDHWTGHTGCVILAPHLTRLTKKELGLPHYGRATERQRKDRMCWEREDELYNDGSAFKITCRTDAGLMVTLIADNYFGYCKKEVKTQIGFSANLFGGCEEEHAGGAVANARYNLGERFTADTRIPQNGATMADVIAAYGDLLDVQPEGYAIDRMFPDVLYVPGDSSFDLSSQTVSWKQGDAERRISIRPDAIYILSNGYRVHAEKHPAAPSWQLIGTTAEGIYCHKPCTVSGGGKSEISKSLMDFFHYGPFFVGDFEKDMRAVEQILARDYSDRHIEPEDYTGRSSRPILSEKRSLGSVIKLLTPSPEYTDEYNAWLRSIPQHVKAIAYIVKRFHRPEWGSDWRRQFTTDLINGTHGNELKLAGRRLVARYLRVGLAGEGLWRTYKVRQDFAAAAKIQMEDDISASAVVPTAWIGAKSKFVTEPSVKVVENCEWRLFQRPDEAIHRGADQQTERDLSRTDNFLSNFEPLDTAAARALIADFRGYGEYTDPMRNTIREAAEAPEGSYFVSSAHPRIVDGKPSKNPRYLQVRPDLLDRREVHVAEMAARLYRRMMPFEPYTRPVNAVLCGRRNNPPEPRVRPLCVYNPIHYQDLPELFMDFVSSLTGKSPSTTGAGSEGALTKGPFNALHATADLNNALLSFILAGHGGFSTAAGWIGPKYRVDHDISLLVPEIWCRLSAEARDPAFLIREGCLERIEDFEYNGRTVLASRLGWRITPRFCLLYLGRVFDNPTAVFNDEMLRPETQDLDVFVDGVDNIVEAQRGVAQTYLEDGSVAAAIPPLQALLHIMATGTWNGKTVHDPEVRAMFTREYVLASDWYRKRLQIKQQRDGELTQRHVVALESFLRRQTHAAEAARLGLAQRLERARAAESRVKSPDYVNTLVGTIGADPLFRG